MDAGSLLTASLARDQKVIRTGGAAPRARGGSAVARRGAHREPVRARVTADVARRVSRRSDALDGPGKLDARLLPCVWLVAGAGGNRARPPRAAVLVLRVGVGGAAIHLRLLRQRGRIVRDGGACCRTRHDRHVEICSACAGYLKTVETEELLPFPLVAIADMETLELDMMALERGASRPSLKEFAPRR